MAIADVSMEISNSGWRHSGVIIAKVSKSSMRGFNPESWEVLWSPEQGGILEFFN